jgi:aspartate/tyrosine/aromatic aminotransferase
LAFDFNKLCGFIPSMERGSVILLQASSHNPTATDPSHAQWEELASLIKQQELLPFFDFAYQGFGMGIEEDAFSVRLFAERFEEMLVAYSFSKNFGLYGERVGVLFIKARADMLEKIMSQIKLVIRENYSTPPCHGARIVKTIYGNHDLKALWQMELKNMRERVMAMRRTFASGLAAKKSALDVNAINKQSGLFAFLGLGKDQVGRLIREYGVYLPSNGRINLAGLNSNNIEYVIDAILAVLD